MTAMLYLTSAATHAGVVLVDFNNTNGDPIPVNWNSIDDPAVSSQPLHDSAGNPTPATISLDGMWNNSSNTQATGAFAGTDFATAARDYFYITYITNPSTITISGLVDSTPYRIELVSSRTPYNSNRIADFTAMGSFADDPSGYATPHHNGDDFRADTHGYDAGMLMEWSSVMPVGGQITLLAEPPADLHNAYINAMRITGLFGVAGDLDFDGNVTFHEAATVAANINLAGASWADGDFNGNGVVDVDDATSAVGNLPAPAMASELQPIVVPEPAGAAVLLLAASAIIVRRRGPAR
jgi:hypothetical protein